jgi:hypothetical protein
MTETNPREKQAEELGTFIAANEEFLKSLKAAHKKLKEGSTVEYSYMMEKLNKIINHAKYSMEYIRYQEDQIEKQEKKRLRS